VVCVWFADMTDECLSSPCFGNATCQDGLRSFTCLCDDGYLYNGTACVPGRPIRSWLAFHFHHMSSLSDSQVSISLVIHGLWWTVSGQVKAHVVLTWIYKWGLDQSPFCDCGQRQTKNHIVDTCPLTKFEGRLNLVHEADDDAVIWLESTATATLAK